MREYRRDAQRYVKGDTAIYPQLPLGYFDRETEVTLTALREKAVSCRSAHLLSSIATATEATDIRNTWQSSASRIYRNWLECICARKRESGEKHDSSAKNSADRDALILGHGN
jgi:homoserine O-succinyltransferase